MIIDGGSCKIVACTILVEQLNECGEIRVKKQVLVSFSIGKYSD